MAAKEVRMLLAGCSPAKDQVDSGQSACKKKKKAETGTINTRNQLYTHRSGHRLILERLVWSKVCTHSHLHSPGRGKIHAYSK